VWPCQEAVVPHRLRVRQAASVSLEYRRLGPADRERQDIATGAGWRLPGQRHAAGGYIERGVQPRRLVFDRRHHNVLAGAAHAPDGMLGKGCLLARRERRLLQLGAVVERTDEHSTAGTGELDDEPCVPRRQRAL